MATTLAEYAKLSQDILLKGVIETIIKDSPVLQKLPFIEIVGNSLAYNREKAMTAAAFYAVNGSWTAPPAIEFDKLTAELKILGQDADVDNYVRATRQNIQDIEAAIIELTAKSVRYKFESTFIYGDTSVEADAFMGIRKLIGTPGRWVAATAYALATIIHGTAFNGYRYECTTAGTSHATAEPTWPTVVGATVTDNTVVWTCRESPIVSMGGTGAAVTLAKVDELIDTVKGGKPDLLLMSRRSRRKLTFLMRALASLEVGQDEFGQFITLYNGIPIAVNDWVLDVHVLTGGTETAITGGANSTIYAMQFGEGALCGITGPGGVTVERVGVLESKDATRTRIKWYCALADFATIKRAALIGVQD